MSRAWLNDGTPRPTTNAAAVAAKTAAYTVTSDDHDCLITLNNVVGFTTTLPAAASYPGLRVHFLNKVANTSGEMLFAVASGDVIRGAGLAETTSKGIRLTQATSRKGDSLTLMSDGGTGWVVLASVGTYIIEA